jgi:hypothetical protein
MAVTSALIIPIEFSALQSSKTQKVVIFHDPNTEESVKKLGVMQKIDMVETYGSEYEYFVCDVTLPQNKDEVQEAGFTKFPQIFTQTNEGGIEPFGGDFSVETFSQFHEFRIMDLTENNVKRVKDTDGVGDVEGVNGLLALSAERPVFVKMYEVIDTPFV